MGKTNENFYGVTVEKVVKEGPPPTDLMILETYVQE